MKRIIQCYLILQRKKLTIKQHNSPHKQDIKILELKFVPKHTFSKYIHNTTVRVRNTPKILNALTSSHWGKSIELLLNTYTDITRTTLEYGSTIWPSIISNTNTIKLQTIQNTALHIATGCTRHKHTTLTQRNEHTTNQTIPTTICIAIKTDSIAFGTYTTSVHTTTTTTKRQERNHNHKP